MTSKPNAPDKVGEIVNAIAELQERLALEKTKTKSRQRLHAYLETAGLTRADVLAVVANVFAKVAKGRLPDAPAKAARKRRSDHGTMRGPGTGRALQPAVGPVGKAIRAARLAANLSTSALGEKIGSGSGHVSQWERGKARPGPAKVAALARALKVPPDRFVNGDAR